MPISGIDFGAFRSFASRRIFLARPLWPDWMLVNSETLLTRYGIRGARHLQHVLWNDYLLFRVDSLSELKSLFSRVCSDLPHIVRAHSLQNGPNKSAVLLAILFGPIPRYVFPAVLVLFSQLNCTIDWELLEPVHGSSICLLVFKCLFPSCGHVAEVLIIGRRDWRNEELALIEVSEHCEELCRTRFRPHLVRISVTS